MDITKEKEQMLREFEDYQSPYSALKERFMLIAKEVDLTTEEDTVSKLTCLRNLLLTRNECVREIRINRYVDK
jgi:hypothetical protein